MRRTRKFCCRKRGLGGGGPGDGGGGCLWTKRKAGCFPATRPRAEKQENSPVYLLLEVRKLAQTDLFTSFEKRGNSPKLGGGKLHLAAFNLRSLASFNPAASPSSWRSTYTVMRRISFCLPEGRGRTELPFGLCLH